MSSVNYEMGQDCGKIYQKLLLSGFLLVIVFQFLLFRSFVLREIEWIYPRYHDQACYLAVAYELFDQTLSNGPWRTLLGPWLGYCGQWANGVMQPIQASLLFTLFGASRLTALSLNFIWFAIFQLSFVWASWKLTRQASAPLIGLGLLLSANTPFLAISGITDFRLDFAVFCMFGTFVSLVIGSHVFLSRRWSLIAGGVASVLILFRFFTALYILGIYCIVLLIVVIKWYWRGNDSSLTITNKTRTFNIFLSGLVILVICILPLWFAKAAILDYYAPKDSVNPWAMLGGVYSFTLSETILYYPKQLAQHYLGTTTSRLLILLAPTYLALILFNWSKHRASLGKVSSAISFVCCSFFVPLLVLTVTTIKAPHVTGILVPSIIWAFVVMSPWNTDRTAQGSRFVAQCLVALGVFLAGIFCQFSGYSRHDSSTFQYNNFLSVNALYETMGRYSELMDWSEPRVSFDSLRDYLGGSPVLTPLYYEKEHKLVKQVPRLGGSVMSISEEQALSAVKDSDFFVLSGETAPESELMYPFVVSMNALKPVVGAVVRKELVFLGSYTIEGQNYELFARPSFGISGFSPDGWLTDKGITLLVPDTVARDCSQLVMSGDWLEGMPSDMSIRAEIVGSPGKPRTQIEVEHGFSQRKNLIRITLPDQIDTSSVDGVLRIKVSFSNYFIPKEVGMNQDTRRLIALAPKVRKALLR